MAVDLTQELRLVQSPVVPTLIIITAIMLAGVSVGMAIPLFPNATLGRQQFYWWFGAFFFALGAVSVLKNAFGENRPTLTLSPQGFRFNTVSDRIIPWSVVRRISRWRHRTSLILIVQVTEQTWETAGMTEAALKMRAANKMAGIDGVAISASGLPIRFDALQRAFSDYADRYR